MPFSLRYLSLSYCDMRQFNDRLVKLTDLKTLHLHDCRNCVSLPPNICPAELKLVNCSIQSLPIGLRYLELLFSNSFESNYIIEKCWNQLVNLETLSITSEDMKLLPEEVARLHNLQKLQLKDCASLKKLPSNLHELVNLHTLDISITRIKSLPRSFVKLRNLQHLILPKCFNLESLPTNLKQVYIIDDTEKAYYEYKGYCASLYQTSTDTSHESENEETEQSVVPGESCNAGYDNVPTARINEFVLAEQITSEQGGVSHIYKDSHLNGSKDPVGELSQHTAFSSQNQFTPLGSGKFRNAHGTAPISQHIYSCDGNNFIGGLNNYQALEFVHNNNNSQSYDADAVRQEKAILEKLPTNIGLIDAAGYTLPKDMPENVNVMNRRLKYYCSMQSPPRGLGKAEHLKFSLCTCSKELLENLKDSMSLQYLAIKDCSQHHVKKFPTNLSELANLKTLSIRCIHVESLPSFAGLSSLLKLYVGGISSLAPRLEKLPADLDKLYRLLVVDIHDTKIKCLPWSIKKLQKLRFLFLPLDFRLETLPSQLIESVVITVDSMHIRKTWKELKAELGLSSFCGAGIDEAHNRSTVSSSAAGYLRLKEDPGLWIMKNCNLCLSVLSLELELPDITLKISDSLGELRKLTYLYISGIIFLNLKHLPNTSMTLRHLSLQHCNVESLSDSLGKLSNLETLCLDLGDTNLPDNLDLLVSLRHLSLRHGSKHSNIDSMANLSYVKALDLIQCDFESLPENLNLAELKLSSSCIRSLPTSLYSLEILHDKGTCKETKCDVTSLNLKQLINMEKLSVTCYSMELLPSIERLQNLQELRLKDCSSLEALPNYLGKLFKLCTLDISGTKIKSLPDCIRKLKSLILPKGFQQDCSYKYPGNEFNKVLIDDIVELYFNDKSYDDYYETSMETSNEGNRIKLDSVEGNHEALSKELEEGITNVTPSIGDFCPNRRENLNSGQSISSIQNDQNDTKHASENRKGENQIHQNDTKSKKRKEIYLETLQLFSSKNMTLEDSAKEIGDFPSNRRESSNPEGQSIPAVQNDIITTMETEQGICENEQNQNLQNDMKVICRKDISKEMLQSFVSKGMTMEEAAVDMKVSRVTVRRRAKDLNFKWPRQKNGKQHPDAKKRKQNNKAPYGSDCSQQNLVNPGNSAAHAKTVGECIMGSGLHTLSNPLSSNFNVVINSTSETIRDGLIGNKCDMDYHQHAQEQLDGANEPTLSNTLQRNENLSDFFVKATYREDTIKFKFSLSCSIDQLNEEVVNRLQIEANTFKIKYQDEEKDCILVTKISDIENALNFSRSNNSSVVRLLIVPKT